MTQKATGTLTVGNIVRVAAVRYGDREAIFCSSTGGRFSFREVNLRANGLANGLMSLGLKKGDVAAFLCTNRAEIVEIYFALAKAGIVGIPLNYRLAPAEMIELMNHFRLEGTRLIQQKLVQAGIDLCLSNEQLCDIISSGLESYKHWCLQSLEELPPARVWSDYVFCDREVDSDILSRISEELMFLIETRFYVRAMRPEMPEVLWGIQKMGLKIGLISNVNSRGQVPTNLKEYGIFDYFHPIVLSSEYGCRKPDPAIFYHAARLANVPTSQCVYVGDRIARDIEGARRAGFGMAVQIRHDFNHGEDDRGAVPDAVISHRTKLLEILHAEADIQPMHPNPGKIDGECPKPDE